MERGARGTGLIPCSKFHAPCQKMARAETTPRVLLPWSHYPSVCGRWFGSYPPRRARSNSIAAFLEVWRFTCRVTILGAAPTTDLFGRSGELPLMCGFTPTPPGLRPSDASIASLAGGLSYLARHAGHILAFWESDSQSASTLCGSEPATMRVSCGCRRLLSCEMPHTVCLSPVGYSTESQDNVRACTRPPPLALRHHPCRQGSDE